MTPTEFTSLQIERKNHLFNRAGFGVLPSEIEEIKNKDIDQIIDEFLNHSAKSNLNLVPGKREKDMFSGNLADRYTIIKSLIHEMAFNKKERLNNRMMLFWLGYFPCKISYNATIVQFLDIIKRNALGNFRTMLIEVSKSAAMMHFLNNQQNLLQNPNENYSRELLELFTLGPGNYTEKDIAQATISFAQWKVKPDGAHYIEPYYINKSKLEFQGKKSVFKPGEIIDLILNKKETATFICKKVYKYFVSEKVNNTHVNELADVLYKSKYDISVLMKYMLKSDWFYDPSIINQKVKSPIDLVINIIQLTKMDISVYYLKMILDTLGQVPFSPPNVGGWKRGMAWLSGITYLHRLNQFYLLSKDVEVDPRNHKKMKPKAYMNNGVNQRKINFDLEELFQNFNEFKTEQDWIDLISIYLPKSKETKTIAKKTFQLSSKKSVLEGLRFLLTQPAFQFA